MLWRVSLCTSSQLIWFASRHIKHAVAYAIFSLVAGRDRCFHMVKILLDVQATYHSCNTIALKALLRTQIADIPSVGSDMIVHSDIIVSTLMTKF